MKKMKIKKNNSLKNIEANRTGGSIAIKGFNFQFLYSCFVILEELSKDKDFKIKLEGIDDIDILHRNEYIQVKTSKNTIDSNRFWSMGVLQNNLQVYQYDKDTKFRFVYDTEISKGFLKLFENKKYTDDFIDYWNKKLNIDPLDLEVFLKQITFEKNNKEDLIKKCIQLLIKTFDLNNSIENQYLIALLYHVSKWSEERKTVTYKDVMNVIQALKDSASKTQSNQSIQRNLIKEVSFDVTSRDELGYYDGKSAKPIHIALDLPVVREKWEETLLHTIHKFDVSVIKASSGQGKSTLAWQVAKKLKNNGYTIYQLNYCNTIESVEMLVDFFEARLKIGQMPLIVIDNLDMRIKEWAKLAERLFAFPIKFIITSREEDWFRYGADISKLNLTVTDIHLFQDEAKHIFRKLKDKNKINSSVTNWQSAWEKVHKNGLLIEYVYLLTHGKMLHERLQTQVEQLNNDKDAKAKLEILRLVTLSDIMNIKIQTKKLSEYINQTIIFEGDRGEVFRALSKEYYIQFSNKYIGGLHPIRSKHLVAILHEYVSIEESLVNLLDIIEDEYVYDYFLNLPSLFSDTDTQDFLKDVSKRLANRDIKIIVEAIDGLMHYEPYSHWKKNQKIYDDVYSKDLIQFFVNFNSVFINIDTFEDMQNIEEFQFLDYLVDKKKMLTEFSFENTFVYQICLYLSQELSNKTITNFTGLDYLVKWFKKTDNFIPELVSFDEKSILTYLHTKNLKEVSSLFTYLYVKFLSDYIAFINKNKNEIFSVLKVKTDSLEILEENDEILIKYIAHYEKMGNLNKCSMNRIEAVYSVFPNYDKYKASVIYFPYPNDEIYKWSIIDAEISIPKENLFDDFDVHLNVIWRKTIMKYYSYESIYEWQLYYVQLRKKLINFTMECNRLFEYIFEGKKTKNIEPIYDEVFELFRTEKDFPISIKLGIKEPFEEERKNINDFVRAFRNFMNQLVQLLDRSNMTSPFMNLEDAFFKLQNMQNSFEVIQKETYHYFDLNELKVEENYWYERLKNTIEFYINSDLKKINNAKEYIKNWINKREEKLLFDANTIFDSLSVYGFNLFKPTKITQVNNYKEITIGIEGYEENLLEIILYELIDFKFLDIDYINIIIVDNQEAIGGFRVSKTFLETILDEQKYEDDDFIGLLPILKFTEELLNPISITVKQQKENKELGILFQCIYKIWKLSQYNAYLNRNNKEEEKWYQEMVKNTKLFLDNNKLYLTKEEFELIVVLFEDINNISTDILIEVLNKLMQIYKI